MKQTDEIKQEIGEIFDFELRGSKIVIHGKRTN